MILDEKDIKRLTLIFLVLLLIVTIFFVVRPILIATIGGLLLAYIFSPFYKRVQRIVKNKTASAFIVTISIIVVIAAIIWFIAPLLMKQIFDIYTASLSVNAYGILKSLLPSAPESFITQLSSSVNTAIGQASSRILESLRDMIIELPSIGLNFFVMGFVFFFAMRDGEQLAEFFKGLSPFTETREKMLLQHFRTMTDSVVYGQVIIGIVQGSLAGLGFILFGVNNALVLTILAIFFSIIPFIGPMVIWVPVWISMMVSNQWAFGPLTIGYLLYNLLIVSLIDNLLRTYLVAKKTAISQAIVMVGMIGGLYLFGIMGLVIGPLLMVYLVTLLDAFRDRSAFSIFKNNNEIEKTHS
jgi:predicted PurR-regulated permease PerM